MKHFFFSALTAFTFISRFDNERSNTNTSNNSLLGTRQLGGTSLNDESFTLSYCAKQNTINFTNTEHITFAYYLRSNSGNCNTDGIKSGGWTKQGENFTVSWDESYAGLEVYHIGVTELSGNTPKWKATSTGQGELKETHKTAI